MSLSCWRKLSFDLNIECKYLSTTEASAELCSTQSYLLINLRDDTIPMHTAYWLLILDWLICLILIDFSIEGQLWKANACWLNGLIVQTISIISVHAEERKTNRDHLKLLFCNITVLIGKFRSDCSFCYIALSITQTLTYIQFS